LAKKISAVKKLVSFIMTNKEVNNLENTALHTVPQKRYNAITVGTINVRTLSNNIKLGQAFDVFNTLRHDVCMFQEIRRVGYGCIDGDNGQKFIWSGMARKKAAGVGIMISDRVKLVDTKFISPRILQILVVMRNLRVAITCCYAPTDCSTDSQKDLFYRNLRRTLEKTSKSYKHLLAGDFNSTIGRDNNDVWNCLGRTNYEEKTNDNGTRLLRTAEEFKPASRKYLPDHLNHDSPQPGSPRMGLRKGLTIS
jgi:exonuclease III